MSVNYNGKLDASITNDINDKNILQQVYVSIVPKKSGTNQEFAFTVLKENDAASPGFIGTLMVNSKDFDYLKKAHKLDCKFEDFPILVEGVVENSYAQLHIAEGTCRVIFHGENVHFELKTKLYPGRLADYFVENAQKIANDVPTPDVEPLLLQMWNQILQMWNQILQMWNHKASVLELKKTPAECENDRRAEKIECSDEIEEDGKIAELFKKLPNKFWEGVFKYVSRDDLDICMRIWRKWKYIIERGTMLKEMKQIRVVSLKHGYSPSSRFMIDLTSQRGKQISMIEGAGLLNPKHILKNSIVKEMNESFRIHGGELKDQLMKINKLICDRIKVKSFILCFEVLDAFGDKLERFHGFFPKYVKAYELTIRGIYFNVLFKEESWKNLDFETDTEVNIETFLTDFNFSSYIDTFKEFISGNYLIHSKLRQLKLTCVNAYHHIITTDTYHHIFNSIIEAFRESTNLDKFLKSFLFEFSYSESLVEEFRYNFEENYFKLIDNEQDHLDTSTFRLSHSKLNRALEAIICKDCGSPYLNVTFKMVEL